MRYHLTITHEDDTTSEMSGLDLEAVLQVVLDETSMARAVWFKLEELPEGDK